MHRAMHTRAHGGDDGRRRRRSQPLLSPALDRPASRPMRKSRWSASSSCSKRAQGWRRGREEHGARARIWRRTSRVWSGGKEEEKQMRALSSSGFCERFEGAGEEWVEVVVSNRARVLSLFRRRLGRERRAGGNERSIWGERGERGEKEQRPLQSSSCSLARARLCANQGAPISRALARGDPRWTRAQALEAGRARGARVRPPARATCAALCQCSKKKRGLFLAPPTSTLPFALPPATPQDKQQTPCPAHRPGARGLNTARWPRWRQHVGHGDGGGAKNRRAAKNKTHPRYPEVKWYKGGCRSGGGVWLVTISRAAFVCGDASEWCGETGRRREGAPIWREEG